MITWDQILISLVKNRKMVKLWNNDKTTNTKEEAVGLNVINDICMQTDETLI